MARRQELNGIERASKDLFGQQRLLSVAAVILAFGDRDFVPVEISRTLDVLPSSIQGPLDMLYEMEFIGLAEAPEGQRGRFLQRLPSCFWLLAAELVRKYPSMPTKKDTKADNRLF